MADVGDFMFGLILMISQAALLGMLAVWVESRRARPARVVGGLIVVALVWLSVVAIINRLTGYVSGSDIETNVLIIFALALGWVAGRNRRVSTASSGAEKCHPWVDRTVRSAGSGIQVLAVTFGGAVGLFALFISMSIVEQAAGFWGLVVGFMFFPVTFTVAPFYAGLHAHDWMPVVFTYGGGITAYLAFAFGQFVNERPDAAENDVTPKFEESVP
jgi:hypothetical protein